LEEAKKQLAYVGSEKYIKSLVGTPPTTIGYYYSQVTAVKDRMPAFRPIDIRTTCNARISANKRGKVPSG
jgi:hypothetical protein